MGLHGVGETGERHVFARVGGVEEGLELRGVRMIRDVAGIEHLHREIAPGVLVRLQFHRVKLVVEQTAFAAAQVRVEIVRLQTINDRRAFADLAAFEFQDRDAARGVFVRLENLALRLRVVAGDFFDVVAHAKEQRIERVATGGEQRTAASVLARVPAELSVPGSDAVVVVDFTVVQFAEETLVDDGFGDEELAGVTAFEADAGLDLVLFHGRFDGEAIFPGKREWLFNDDVFAGVRGSDSVFFVLIRIAANGNNVDARVVEHGVEVGVGLDRRAPFLADFGVVEFAGRKNRSDLGLIGGVDGGDVRSGNPAITDDSDIIFFHESSF